jgi:hypothetical protein
VFRTPKSTEESGDVYDDIKTLASIQNELTEYLVFAKKFAKTEDTASLEKNVRESLCSVIAKSGIGDEGAKSRSYTFVNQFFHGKGADARELEVNGARAEAKYIGMRADQLHLWDPSFESGDDTDEKQKVYSQICTNVWSDAFAKVDVVEVHFVEDEQGIPSVITDLWLVQVKNGEIDQSEIVEIQEKHEKFVKNWQEYPMESFDFREAKLFDDETNKIYTDAIDSVLGLVISGDTLEDVMSGAGIDEKTLLEHPERARVFYGLLQSKISTRCIDFPGLCAEVEAKVQGLEKMLSKTGGRTLPVRVELARSVIMHGDKFVVKKLSLPHHEDTESGLLYRVQ